MKKIILIIIIFIFILILIYGFLINPYGFIVKENNINIDNLDNNFKGFEILQISDILINNNEDIDILNDIVDKVNNINPDIIVFTGDLLAYKPSDEDIDSIISILSKLDCKLYKYAVAGDTDSLNIEIYQSIMENSNFYYLDNESVYLFYKSIKPIKIIGLTDTSDINKTLSMDEDLDTIFNLVITHNPSNIDSLNNEDVDVVIAGHNLLGKIRIPFYGGILGGKYRNEYYNINGIDLYVSGGIGTSGVKFRLFNKPEINLYTLD